MTLENTLKQSIPNIENIFIKKDDDDKCIDDILPYLQSLNETLKDNRRTFLIYIQNNIKRDGFVNALTTFDKKFNKFVNSLKKFNTIELDNNLDIKNNKNNDYSSQSKILETIKNFSDKIVFTFGPDGVDCFKNGVRLPSDNIFLSHNDYRNFSKKHNIYEIEDVLKKYNDMHLTLKNNFFKFFEKKAHPIFKDKKIKIKNIVFKNKKIKTHNVLINKPEDVLRDDLVEFLRNNIKASFSTEERLPSEKKIDIFTEVNQTVYFLEVKWIGESINQEGNDITENDEETAKKGVTQTLEYIEELKRSTNKSIQIAYLIVFDARLKRTDINYDSYNYIKKSLKTHLTCFADPYTLSITNEHAK